MGWFEDLFIKDVRPTLNNVPSTGGCTTIIKNDAIIDVLELPTSNIKNAFYRLLTGAMIQNRYIFPNSNVVCVDTLPEVGIGVMSPDEVLTVYYGIESGSSSVYVDELSADVFGVQKGWYSADIFCGALGLVFGGIVTDITDAIDDKGVVYILLTYDIYSYNGKWVSNRSVGVSGSGLYAEVFNSNINIASGNASHAEGFDTVASGVYSHVEGHKSKASGESSHAEGYMSTAEGNSSHAEGYWTFASGQWSHSEGSETAANGPSSHAEGQFTEASGEVSHAEGWRTIAAGLHQHVQGRSNIEDKDGKYAHIVGNGVEYDPSNAHTLDWDGNAWFAGYIEGTHMILSSPNGTRYKITVSDDGTLTASPAE